MPVDGLPSAVETVMIQMLEQNVLSSWKITGGQQYATISLHFKVNMAGQSGVTVQNGTMQYRSKPPSAVTRDKNRMQNWRSKQDVQNYGYLENASLTKNASTQKDIICSTEGTEGSVSHISIQTEERSVLHNPDGQSEDMTSLLSSDPVHDTAPKQMDINIASTETGIVITEKEDSDIADLSSDDIVSLDLPDICMCSVCHKEFQSGMWWKCTKCVVDVCEDCVRNGRHGSHQNRLHKFRKPAMTDSYCDSCGLEFKTRQAKYYMCVSCDNYALCQICMKENMHNQHLLTMKCRSQVT